MTHQPHSLFLWRASLSEAQISAEINWECFAIAIGNKTTCDGCQINPKIDPHMQQCDWMFLTEFHLGNHS